MRQASFASLGVLAAFVLAGLAAGGCGASPGDDPAAEGAPASHADRSSVAATRPDSSPEAATPTATDPSRSVEERVADASMAARVKTALVENRDLRTFDFDPSATDGRVTLTGDVDARALGAMAAEVAAEVEGVDEVLNRLTVDGKQIAWHAEQASKQRGTAAMADGRGEAQGGNSAGNAGQTRSLRPSAADASASSEATAAASDSGGTEYHVVEQGESLWAIAQANGLSVARLRALNDLSGSGLMPGDRLRVE